MNGTKLRLLVTTGIACAAVSACGGTDVSSSNDSTSKGSGASGGPIKIGAWVTTTGPIAVSGVPQVAGTKAYFDMVNDGDGCGGHPVEWITEDNAYDPQQSLQIARQLTQRDKVVAIFGSYGTATTEPTFPLVLNQAKTPIIATAGGAESWYDPPRPMLFGVETLYEDQGAALGAWAVEDGAKNILVVHSDPDAFANVAAGVIAGVKNVEASVAVKTLPVKYHTTDYSPIISQVKSAAPDAVVLILSPEEAAAYLKEAALQKSEAPAYGYAPQTSTALLELAGDSAEGFHTVSLVRSPDDEGPEVSEFRDAMAKYAPEAKADFVTLTAFGRAKIFCEVVGSIDGEVTGESIAEAFASASSVETGIFPEMKFSEDQHLGTRAVQRHVVTKGAFVPVGDFYTPPSRD